MLLRQVPGRKIHLPVSIKALSTRLLWQLWWQTVKFLTRAVIFTKRVHRHPVFFRAVPNYQMSWSQCSSPTRSLRARAKPPRNFVPSRSHCSREPYELHTADEKLHRTCGRFDTCQGYRMLEPFLHESLFRDRRPPRHVRVSPRLERRNKWELSSVDVSQKVDRLLWKRDSWILFTCMGVSYFSVVPIHFQMHRCFYIRTDFCSKRVLQTYMQFFKNIRKMCVKWRLLHNREMTVL